MIVTRSQTIDETSEHAPIFMMPIDVHDPTIEDNITNKALCSSHSVKSVRRSQLELIYRLKDRVDPMLALTISLLLVVALNDGFQQLVSVHKRDLTGSKREARCSFYNSVPEGERREFDTGRW